MLLILKDKQDVYIYPGTHEYWQPDNLFDIAEDDRDEIITDSDAWAEFEILFNLGEVIEENEENL